MAIRFDLEDAESFDKVNNLTTELDSVCFTCKLQKRIDCPNAVRFALPRDLVRMLGLEPKDPCYFAQYASALTISFNVKPTDVPNKHCFKRCISLQGNYSHYLSIPPYIKQYMPDNANCIQIMHIQGSKEYEWTIRFIHSDYI